MSDSVYRERAYLVAHLAGIYPAVIVHGADPQEPDWPVVYVTLPTGQASWHLSPDDLDLFGHVPAGDATWDGHSIEEKYSRVADATAVEVSKRSKTDG